MHILDYRTPANPAHYSVESFEMKDGRMTAQINVSHPLRGDGPSNGYTFPCEVPAIDLGTDPKAAVSEWLVSPSGPFAGCPIVSDAALPLASKRLALASAVKRNRDAKRDGGCTTPAGPVDTDINSRLNIAGAVSMAAIAGAEFSVDWRMSDNSIVTLDAAGVTGMGVAVGQFVAACQARKNVLDAEIDAATTLAELEAIDVDSGWPE